MKPERAWLTIEALRSGTVISLPSRRAVQHEPQVQLRRQRLESDSRDSVVGQTARRSMKRPHTLSSHPKTAPRGSNRPLQIPSPLTTLSPVLQPPSLISPVHPVDRLQAPAWGSARINQQFPTRLERLRFSGRKACRRDYCILRADPPVPVTGELGLHAGRPRPPLFNFVGQTGSRTSF